MPDLNSIPPSPSRSRRPTGTSISGANSIQAPGQAVSPGSINILPSNQQAVNNAASNSSLPSPGLPPSSTTMVSPHSSHGQDSSGFGAGPGPIRHPRPLTAAELHSELEQEQELLVNRLTRDLTMLRAANNSSVVSNASSASASTTDQHASSFTDTHMLSGPGFHIPATSADRRHHRTSSSTSTRSFSQMATQGSTPAPIPIPHHSGSAASVLEAARNPRGASSSMSRQNSTTSHRSQSRNHSPGPYHHGSNPSLGSSSYPYPQHGGLPYSAGDPTSGYFRGRPGTSSTAAATPGSEVLSPGLLPATHRYEETAFYRHELESAKRENDALKRRVKELEKMLREQGSRRDTSTSSTRQQPSTSSQPQPADHIAGASARERTDSVSTTTSAVSLSGGAPGGGAAAGVGGGAAIAPGRRGMERAVSSISFASSVGVGVPEEEVKVAHNTNEDDEVTHGPGLGVSIALCES
ncbi:uncharacterized protein B0I36DRAFT_423652 [Microdochium trichocladiopsis]|uniref:Uncharacterized protein n=1 Tax=Microdochium trichocladiopsis TaxID=1682393 RepID=A0A9P9BNQ0_9PEZI|nr:uncharacterized protein B0I36DRAFT_423652 [Microdochium trichocladiopsis]KAH7027968.1 hypothetical protein B0I36DRAFT_423652 [Microdochium trichocladiopsis]